MEMLDIVLSFVPHYTRWDVLRYIDFQEEKTMNRTHLSVRMLCEAAVMVALAQILSYLKLMELPNGGSLTPAMFPIILFAVRWGTAPGLMAGFVFGLLQLIFDGAYAWGWQSMLLDYLAAFTPGTGRPVQGPDLGHLCRHGGGLRRAVPGPLHQRGDHL